MKGKGAVWEGVSCRCQCSLSHSLCRLWWIHPRVGGVVFCCETFCLPKPPLSSDTKFRLWLSFVGLYKCDRIQQHSWLCLLFQKNSNKLVDLELDIPSTIWNRVDLFYMCTLKPKYESQTESSLVLKIYKMYGLELWNRDSSIALDFRCVRICQH